MSVIMEMKDVLMVDVTEEIWGEEHEEVVSEGGDEDANEVMHMK